MNAMMKPLKDYTIPYVGLKLGKHQFDYQMDNYMTPSATGHVDEVITRILIKGNASEKVMGDYATNALRTCFAGEAVTGATTTEVGIFLNGKLIK